MKRCFAIAGLCLVLCTPVRADSLIDETMYQYQATLNDSERGDYEEVISFLREEFLSKKSSVTGLEQFELTREQFSDVYSTVINTTPELWWVSRKYTLSVDKHGVVHGVKKFTEYRLEDGSTDWDLISSMNEQLSTTIASIKSCVDACSGDYERMLVIHDWIANTVTQAVSDEERVYYGAYGALVNGKATCQGYSHAFAMACKEYGVECDLAFDVDHMWNQVKLGDDWYNVDCMHDDSYEQECLLVDHVNFVKSDSAFGRLERKHSQECNSTKYDYSLYGVYGHLEKYNGIYYLLQDSYLSMFALVDGVSSFVGERRIIYDCSSVSNVAVFDEQHAFYNGVKDGVGVVELLELSSGKHSEVLECAGSVNRVMCMKDGVHYWCDGVEGCLEYSSITGLLESTESTESVTTTESVTAESTESVTEALKTAESVVTTESVTELTIAVEATTEITEEKIIEGPKTTEGDLKVTTEVSKTTESISQVTTEKITEVAKEVITATTEEVQIPIKVTRPAKVKGLTVSAKRSKKLRIAWKKVFGAKYYELQYSTKKNFKKCITKKVYKNKFTTAATHRGKYWVRVRAVKAGVCGKWSAKKKGVVK